MSRKHAVTQLKKKQLFKSSYTFKNYQTGRIYFSKVNKVKHFRLLFDKVLIPLTGSSHPQQGGSNILIRATSDTFKKTVRP